MNSGSAVTWLARLRAECLWFDSQHGGELFSLPSRPIDSRAAHSAFCPMKTLDHFLRSVKKLAIHPKLTRKL
jgi:hypothetical protein